DALEEALAKFPSGIFAIWYPVLQRMESRQFADRLKRLPAKEWLNVTLTTNTPTPDGTGLHSSGMFILNPPYTLEPILREVMPYLVRVLGKDAGARFTIEKGTQVTGAAAGRLAGDAPRAPVGNARRASPLSGKGSLRLPGQSMPRADEAPAAPAKPARAGGPRTAAPRDGVPRGNASRSRADAATGPRDGAPRTARSSAARPTAPSAPRNGRTRQGGGSRG
ncbi:23S rRNA (adenine(2030)-N(6))-methyltransferase RlmJ, partial [Massilia oculi]|uniref:23S rRNA (adenine(2030)-N(6))-methyltransferase RlmJ n=1 Tax=Massilia oculi TaxID=945844 RepID=UPI0028ADAE99